jgi:hypothetical protein
MFTGKRFLAFTLALLLAAAAMTSPAHAWSHQGHILITRLAALRIIQDDKAPKELRDFLQSQMKADLAACEKLATQDVVGPNPAADYLTGLDGASTLPDRILTTKDGQVKLEPYGLPEANMHYLDLEYFAKEIRYQPDLSNLPKLTDFPHDVQDWRYKQAGFVPFRIQEFYKKVVEHFGPGDKLDPAETTHDLGYLAHYLEDCHQPHHATIDYKSLSYLVGKVPATVGGGVKEIKTPLTEGGEAISYRADKSINPHGDLEFQLFENVEEPRVTFRKEFWNELTARIASHAKDAEYQWPEYPARTVPPYDPFTRSLEILRHSYTYLPAIGKAAQAAYADGKFDPKAFFASEDTVHGQSLTIIQLIAEQNARAVLEVEKTLRRAWDTAHAANNPAIEPGKTLGQ